MIEPIRWGGIGGIVLDAVGTLIRPVPSVADAYAEAARRQGVTLDPAMVRRRFLEHFGDDEVDEIRGPLATDEANEVRRWRRIVSNVLPEVAAPDRAFEELWEHFASPESWRVFDDALPALGALRSAGVAVRIASNFDGRLRRVLAGQEGLGPWSEPVIISSEVGFRKPHPAFYRAACESLGMEPSAVLCVGDDVENDVLGPNRAGLRAVLIDRKGRDLRPESLPGLVEMADQVVGGGG